MASFVYQKAVFILDKFTGNVKAHAVTDLWDGHTAKRVVAAIRAIQLCP